MVNKVKKVLFVLGDMERGGAQRVVSILANNFVGEFDVSIAVLLNNTASYELDSSIQIYNLGSEKGSYVTKAPQLVLKLRRLIKTNNYDLIVSFVGRVNLVSILANAGLDCPIVISERNDPSHDNRNKIERLLCKLMYRFPDKVIFQTNYQKKWYGDACEKNGVIIGNPVAMRPFFGQHKEQGIVAVGKLMPQKNYPVLINAYKKISNQTMHDLFIYGEGYQESELKELVETLNISERVHFNGNISNIDTILETKSYYVLSSNYEGLSNSLIEAMTKGMICVSTNWNGIEDVIEHNVNGFIVPIDSSELLANKMLEVIEMSFEKKKLISHNAIETAMKFNTDSIIRIWHHELTKTMR